MSELNDLINKLCPDGVPYKKLGDIVDILDSKRKPVKRGSRVSGKYPYYGANGIQDYINDYLFDGEFLLVGEDGSVITDRGTPILNWASGKIWVNNHAHVLQEKADKQYMLRYIKYALECKNIAMLIHGAIPKLNQQTLKSIEIPVPPLPVQSEIVRILDAFTELEAELEAELADRKEQYEYYRNHLLDKKNLATMDGKPVETKKLLDVADVLYGAPFNAKQFNNDSEGMPLIRIRDIMRGYTETFYTGEYENKYIIHEGDILIGMDGDFNIGKWKSDDALLNQRTLKIKHGETNEIIDGYLYYLLGPILKGVNDRIQASTVKHLTAQWLKRIEIPVPSLATQERVVDILDRFDTLTTSLTDGIPAEIAMRRKQYEYFRSRLLNFSRLPDDAVSDDE